MLDRLSKRSWLIGSALGLSVGAACVLCAALVWLVATNLLAPPAQTTAASDITASLRNSDSAFNVGTRIGQPAPAFTLPDAQGQPYNFHPGDGNKYLLAFNMGSA